MTVEPKHLHSDVLLQCIEVSHKEAHSIIVQVSSFTEVSDLFKGHNQ